MIFHWTVGIVVEAYAPLGSSGRSGDFKKEDIDEPKVLEDTIIGQIAMKHKATPAQVSEHNHTATRVSNNNVQFQLSKLSDEKVKKFYQADDIQDTTLHTLYLQNTCLTHFSLNSLTTIGYLLDVFIKLWIPSMVRIFTSAWS